MKRGGENVGNSKWKSFRKTHIIYWKRENNVLKRTYKGNIPLQQVWIHLLFWNYQFLDFVFHSKWSFLTQIGSIGSIFTGQVSCVKSHLVCWPIDLGYKTNLYLAPFGQYCILYLDFCLVREILDLCLAWWSTLCPIILIRGPVPLSYMILW